jgi:hypothetical protein
MRFCCSVSNQNQNTTNRQRFGCSGLVFAIDLPIDSAIYLRSRTCSEQAERLASFGAENAVFSDFRNFSECDGSHNPCRDHCIASAPWGLHNHTKIS